MSDELRSALRARLAALRAGTHALRDDEAVELEVRVCELDEQRFRALFAALCARDDAACCALTHSTHELYTVPGSGERVRYERERDAWTCKRALRPHADVVVAGPAARARLPPLRVSLCAERTLERAPDALAVARARAARAGARSVAVARDGTPSLVRRRERRSLRLRTLAPAWRLDFSVVHTCARPGDRPPPPAARGGGGGGVSYELEFELRHVERRLAGGGGGGGGGAAEASAVQQLDALLDACVAALEPGALDTARQQREMMRMAEEMGV